MLFVDGGGKLLKDNDSDSDFIAAPYQVDVPTLSTLTAVQIMSEHEAADKIFVDFVREPPNTPVYRSGIGGYSTRRVEASVNTKSYIIETLSESRLKGKSIHLDEFLHQQLERFAEAVRMRDAVFRSPHAGTSIYRSLGEPSSKMPRR